MLTTAAATARSTSTTTITIMVPADIVSSGVSACRCRLPAESALKRATAGDAGRIRYRSRVRSREKARGDVGDGYGARAAGGTGFARHARRPPNRPLVRHLVG